MLLVPRAARARQGEGRHGKRQDFRRHAALGETVVQESGDELPERPVVDECALESACRVVAMEFAEPDGDPARLLRTAAGWEYRGMGRPIT